MQTMNTTPTTKLEKIEQRAWREYNINGRKMESRVMDSIRERWELEVLKITGPQTGAQIRMKMLDAKGEPYYYNFGDIVA